MKGISEAVTALPHRTEQENTAIFVLRNFHNQGFFFRCSFWRYWLCAISSKLNLNYGYPPPLWWSFVYTENQMPETWDDLEFKPTISSVIL